MIDNGSCCIAKDFVRACTALGLKHIRAKPYTPKTKGKAERFIQTALREWAYARAYQTSDHRKAHLPNMEPHVQLASSVGRLVIKNTHQSPPFEQGQRVEAPHPAPSDASVRLLLQG
jgi:transposase InsO family protein